MSDAPPPPKRVSKAADEVLRLVPDEGRSLRGLKTGVGRISSSYGLKVESWDDGLALHVRPAGK